MCHQLNVGRSQSSRRTGRQLGGRAGRGTNDGKVTCLFEEDFAVLQAAFTSAPLPSIQDICFKPEPHIICQIACQLSPIPSNSVRKMGEDIAHRQLLRLCSAVEL